MSVQIPRTPEAVIGHLAWDANAVTLYQRLTWALRHEEAKRLWERVCHRADLLATRRLARTHA